MSDTGGYGPDDPAGEPTYPTYPQYGQPEYGQPQYGQPPPAQRSKPTSGRLTALLIAGVLVIGALVVVILALGSGSNGSKQATPAGPTGFPTSSLATPPTVPPTLVPTGTSPGIVLPSVGTNGTGAATLAGINFFSALSTHNLAAIQALACPGSAVGLTQAKVDRIIVALPTGPAAVSGSSATMNGSAVRSDGSRAVIVARLRETGMQWCLTGVSGG